MKLNQLMGFGAPQFSGKATASKAPSRQPVQQGQLGNQQYNLNRPAPADTKARKIDLLA